MNKLKEFREGMNIMQKDFAEILNVAPSTYNQWETGKREPDIASLTKIADFYKVSIDELIGRGATKKEPAVDAFADDKLSLEIMELFAKLSETEKQIVLAQIKGITSDRK